MLFLELSCRPFAVSYSALFVFILLYFIIPQMPPCFLRREGYDVDPDGSGGGLELGGVGGEKK